MTSGTGYCVPPCPRCARANGAAAAIPRKARRWIRTLDPQVGWMLGMPVGDLLVGKSHAQGSTFVVDLPEEAYGERLLVAVLPLDESALGDHFGVAGEIGGSEESAGGN